MNYREEITRVQSYVHGNVWDILSQAEAVVAGGAVTSVFCGSEINDIDVYFKSEAHFSDALRAAEASGQMWQQYQSKRAITYGASPAKRDQPQRIIQFVRAGYYQTVSDIFTDFDFTVCMGAYDPAGDVITVTNSFIMDNLKKRLRFNTETRFPIDSVRRITKYLAKGYTISPKELLIMGLTCADTDISSWSDLVDQVSGFYGDNLESEVAGHPDTEYSLENSTLFLRGNDNLLEIRGAV